MMARSLEKLRWTVNRVRCMSGSELVFRARNAARAGAERAGLLLARQVPTPHPEHHGARWLQTDQTAWPTAQKYITCADRLLQGQWNILALQDVELGHPPLWNRDPKTGCVAPLCYGPSMDYSNVKVAGDIKYLWEMNRHLQWVTLAQAFHLTTQSRYLEGLGAQIDSWLAQCPYPRGAAWASALEIGIRLINWSGVWSLIGGWDAPLFAGAAGAERRARWLEAIYRHMHFIDRHLSGHSSANNHLIGELAGLYIGAFTWPYWTECAAWRQCAQENLEHEVMVQITPDGVGREQAMAYQHFVLNFLLLAACCGRANGSEFKPEYWSRIEQMMEFIAALMDAQGNVPMIGDADDGLVMRLDPLPEYNDFYRAPLAIGAVLFDRADFKYKAGQFDDYSRWLLGARGAAVFDSLGDDSLDTATHPLPFRRAFQYGGYFVLGEEFDTSREVRLVVDAGPLGYLGIAAHGHADALALTLSVAGKEFLIDPGTYSYHGARKWRDYFRGTAAHNTLRVDGLDQSTPGGRFMWLHKANVVCESFELTPKRERFVGYHDGYRRLPDGVLHRREVVFEKSTRRIMVNDTVDCAGPHVVELLWHFAEDCVVSLIDGGVKAVNGAHTLTLSLSHSCVQPEIRYGSEDPPSGWISRAYDRKVPTSTVVWTVPIKEAIILRTEIVLPPLISTS